VIILAIAYLSLTPKETITIGNDKISHFIAYGTLMFNAGILTYPDRKKFVTAFLLCFAYGVLIEVGQHYVPGRHMSSLDVVANFSGAVIGAVLTLVLHKPADRILKKLKIR
jgi:VanZ family protein